MYPALWVRTNYIQQFLLVQNRLQTMLKLQIIERSMWLLIIPFKLFAFDKWAAYILPILGGLVVHALLGYHYINPYNVKNEIFPNIHRGLITKTRHIGLISVISDALNLDTVIVARLTSIDSAASYSLSQKFRGPLLLGFNSFATRLRPIAATGKRGLIGTLFRQERKFLFLNYLILVVSIIFFFIFGNYVFGFQFPHINLILSTGVIVAIPNSLSVISSSFLIAIGFEKEVFRSFFVWVPMTLATVGVTSYFLGAIAAVVALLVCYLPLSLFLCFFGWKQWNKLL